MNNLKGKPFALLGVHGFSYPPAKLKQVMDKEKMNWRSFAADSALFNKWAARGTPTYYLIDHKGLIRYKWIGGHPGAKAFDNAIEHLLKEATPEN